MKWLHLSDIHMSQNVNGTDTRLLRKQLLNYLQQEVGFVDLLLLSGDYRYCGQPNEPDKVYAWICQIANAVGIRDLSSQVCMVPGNHDITRSKVRDYVVTGVKQAYKVADGRFESGVLESLLPDFLYYDKLYQKIHTRSYIEEALAIQNPHQMIDFRDFSLLMLNTALLSNDDAERGSLLVGADYVAELDPGSNIVVVLAHHGMELLQFKEQAKLKEIFKQWGTVLYLCGDTHTLLGERIGDHIWQVTSGYLRGTGGTDIAFTTGENTGPSIIVTAHEWRKNWTIAPHFGNCGVLEIGRWEWDRLERVEPALKRHIQAGIEECQQRDIPIHTPQILLFLLTYPGSVLFRVLNEYFAQNGLRYGAYFRKQLENINMQYAEMDDHFHWDFDLIQLLNLESAEDLRYQKKLPHITENLLSHAVLAGKNSSTIRLMHETLGPFVFEEVKKKVLWRATPDMDSL